MQYLAVPFDRLEDYSQSADKSTESIVNEAINNEITRCEVKNILVEKCGENELANHNLLVNILGKKCDG